MLWRGIERIYAWTFIGICCLAATGHLVWRLGLDLGSGVGRLHK